MAGPFAIRAIDLHKRFGDNDVLRGLSLDLAAGSTTVILGQSGSGKSVLLKHLIGLLEPDRGRVEIDGIDLGRAAPVQKKRIRTEFGMVFQLAALFDSLTVFENVVFPLDEHRKDLSAGERRERVMDKLEALQLADSASKYPDELSGGMRKRAGLARAVVMDPKYLLYDEPTTGLDPLMTESVDEMIMAAAHEFGVTSIVISHDLTSALRIADQVAFLDDGIIVEQAPPAQFRKSSHPMVVRFLRAWEGGRQS